MNPPENENVPVETFESAIQSVEVQLGLTDQPRAIVFHEKEGRRHAHAVWSRINGQEMKAINLPHYKRRLNEIARDLYHEHGWEMPNGFKDKRNRDPLAFTLDEWQQSKRTKQDPNSQNRSSANAGRGLITLRPLKRLCRIRVFHLRAGIGAALSPLTGAVRCIRWAG